MKANVPFYGLGVAAVFVPRCRLHYQPGVRVPGYPWVPAFIFASGCLLLSNLVDSSTRLQTLFVLLVILLGVPVYYATVGRRGGRSAT